MARGSEVHVFEIAIRIAHPDEYEQLAALYLSWGYRGGLSSADVVYVAERGGRIAGLVRRTHEGGMTMLRGMYVDPAQQRRRVGTHLLRALVEDLNGAEWFCLPFAHLIAFYEGAGFAVVAEDAAPPFLVERLRRYRQEGRDVLIMRRQ